MPTKLVAVYRSDMWHGGNRY